jgi:hypothetical protein
MQSRGGLLPFAFEEIFVFVRCSDESISFSFAFTLRWTPHMLDRATAQRLPQMLDRASAH